MDDGTTLPPLRKRGTLSTAPRPNDAIMRLKYEAACPSHARIMSNNVPGRSRMIGRTLRLVRIARRATLNARIAALCAAGACAAVSAVAVAAAPRAPGHAAEVVGSAAGSAAAQLVDSSELAMRTDPEVSRQDAEKALALLSIAPNVDLAVRAHLLLCDYQSERDSQAAEEQIAAASALLPEVKRQGLRAGVPLCQGEIFENAGRTADAMAQYDRAIDLATRWHDDPMLAEALFSHGYLIGVQGKYAEGLAELKRAQALFEKLGKPMHALTTLNAVALLYNSMGDYAQARHIYLGALNAQRGSGLLRDQAVTLHNLGRADENLHDWAAARAAFSESLAIFRRIDYPRGEAYALRGLAEVANASGDPKSALDTLSQADALQRSTTDARLRAQIELTRGAALHRLGQLSDSAAALRDAARLFRDTGRMDELDAAETELAAVDADAGNWREAFDLEHSVRTTSERLLQNQLDQRFATLKVEFDTASEAKENAALLRENAANQQALAQGGRARRLQRIVILLGTLLASVLALLAVIQYRTSARMRALAMTDELTRLPNRRAVLARLDALLRGSNRRPCSALIVDIDHFKEINDRHGHPMGDEVLKAMAAALLEAVRAPAFFGRLGGEEFLIVLPDIDLHAARSAAEHFRERVACIEVMLGTAGRGRITVSIGVADSTSGDTLSDLLRRADAALYAAKRSGRNCVRAESADLAEVGQLALDV